MAVNAAQSGSRWKFGAATMALATAFAVVAACSSDADQSPAPTATGSHSAHAGGSSAPPQPLRAGERFVELKMAEAYTVPGARSGPEKEAFLTGTQVRPGNVAIAKTPGLGWQCFGGTGVAGADVEDDEGADPGAAWVDTWAPGATETLLDQDAGASG